MLAWQERFDAIGDVRGLGAMLAIELVDDRATEGARAGARDGVARAGGGARAAAPQAGVYSNCIRVLCPLVITDAELEEALGVWEEALEAVLRSRARRWGVLRTCRDRGRPPLPCRGPRSRAT